MRTQSSSDGNRVVPGSVRTLAVRPASANRLSSAAGSPNEYGARISSPASRPSTSSTSSAIAAYPGTASNRSSSNGRRSARASTHSANGSCRRATASIAGLRSTPTTSPSRPTRSRAVRATTPVPHATSSTRSP